eukprot:scaffold135302_cov69-Cyclotella_meneghiniana.AAC.11
MVFITSSANQMTLPGPPVAFLHPLMPAYGYPPTSRVSSSLSSHSFSASSLPSSSSHFLAVDSTPTIQTSYEAVVPDASLLIGFGSVVVLCVIAAFVWANEVVPVSRTKLAISKSRGEVREYLDGLEQKYVEEPQDGSVDSPETRINAIVEEDGRGFERWLFSDWLNKPSSKGGRQKEPALPILKDAKWNSGDNPVLVTAGIMMIGIVIASITERVSS